MSDHEPDPLVGVMRDLSAIVALTETLPDEAESRADDQEMPGGDALVMLAWVANLEARENLIEYAETHGLDSGADLEDPAWEPPLQTLCFWSEAWREEHGRVSDRRPTIASEADFLRQVTAWAYDNEPRFEDYEADVRKALGRLEALLREGLRNESGAPCLGCGRTLVRPVADRRGHDAGLRAGKGDRGGLRDWWECRNRECERGTYTVDEYRRAVAQLHYAHAEWLPVELAAQRTGASRGSITGWASKGQVRRRRDESGRVTYRVGDIETRQGKAAEVAS